ncbi:gene transfer agent family protein [Phreatobacter sp.]|uniref:gene transfer agent family protein n=1 Tax=Phreatobacter sp. TaxID=1966341 RepID=UPI003F7297DE
MPNRHRGEIAADLGGRSRRLVLTLASLAELEAHFEAADLVELADRFASGRLAARDLAAIIGAGLRGAGETISDAEAAALAVEGGAGAYARIVSELLTASFGSAEVAERQPAGAPAGPFAA